MTIRVIFTNETGKFVETICETMGEAVEVRNQRRAEGRFARIYAGSDYRAARGA